MEKSYYEIALRNLEFLEASLCNDYYNDLAPLAEQVAEKMLKSVLELVDPDAKLMLQSHNLKNIYIRIKEAGVNLDLDKGALSSLKDVYFEARYPGENYIDVSYEDCTEYLHTMYRVIDEVNLYRFDNNLPYTKVSEKTLGTSLISSIDSVFNEYRNKFNFVADDNWMTELARLSKLFGTTDMATLARNIKDTFL